MKVFINKREGVYSGGMIIVAANNVEEAQNILLKTYPDDTYSFDKDGDICYDKEESVTVENYYYKKDNWIELPDITASFEKPTFIAESGHTE